jgi:hypothetical protein
MIKDLYSFIGVDQAFIPDITEKHNVSVIPKNKIVSNMVKGLNPVIKHLRDYLPQSIKQSVKSRMYGKPEKLSIIDRDELIKIYESDIKKLEVLISRDLSAWYTDKS